MLRRRVARALWEAKLRSLGAEPLSGRGRLNSAEWWRRPGRPPFTVPLEEDGECDFWALQKIIHQQGGRTPFDPKIFDD